MACLPTTAAESVRLLEGRNEASGWVRAASAFALGELGAVEPSRRILAEDISLSARCMAAFRKAVAINPASAARVQSTGKLAELLSERDDESGENPPGNGGRG
ncbi:hypothetical protein [Aquisphaera insulae]|uniref:hypothetical protein n=1 Tax=Aquisphaera insulae TaxID=2712864 RepID=UPI0013EB2041|nr:hypothetical protein [Aquisphaera insulae]